MKPVCPSEDRLKSLIMEAFNELPSPDPARIQRIATTLSRQTTVKRKPRQSWLFWLLLGGSMTAAAWWAGDTFFTKKSVSTDSYEAIKQPAQMKQKPTNQSEQRQMKQKLPPKLNVNPIIDQRERY